MSTELTVTLEKVHSLAMGFSGTDLAPMSLQGAAQVQATLARSPEIALVFTDPGSAPAELAALASGGQKEVDPVFGYTDGVLTRIDYASGNYRLLSYTYGLLTYIDYVTAGGATRKTLNRDGQGVLVSVTESVV